MPDTRISHPSKSPFRFFRRIRTEWKKAGWFKQGVILAIIGALIARSLEPVNHAPVAANDHFTIHENEVLSSNVIQSTVDCADLDPDGNVLLVTSWSTFSKGEISSYNSAGDFVFDPGKDFDYLQKGETADVKATYVVEDGFGGKCAGVVRITVLGVNDSPAANDDHFNGVHNSLLAGNVLDDNGNGPDSDPDGELLEVMSYSQPVKGGKVLINRNGDFQFDPDGAFNKLPRSDTQQTWFSYDVADPYGQIASGTVLIDVIRGPPQIPVQPRFRIPPWAGKKWSGTLEWEDVDGKLAEWHLSLFLPRENVDVVTRIELDGCPRGPQTLRVNGAEFILDKLSGLFYRDDTVSLNQYGEIERVDDDQLVLRKFYDSDLTQLTWEAVLRNNAKPADISE